MKMCYYVDSRKLEGKQTMYAEPTRSIGEFVFCIVFDLQNMFIAFVTVGFYVNNIVKILLLLVFRAGVRSPWPMYVLHRLK